MPSIFCVCKVACPLSPYSSLAGTFSFVRLKSGRPLLVSVGGVESRCNSERQADDSGIISAFDLESNEWLPSFLHAESEDPPCISLHSLVVLDKGVLMGIGGKREEERRVEAASLGQVQYPGIIEKVASNKAFCIFLSSLFLGETLYVSVTFKSLPLPSPTSFLSPSPRCRSCLCSSWFEGKGRWKGWKGWRLLLFGGEEVDKESKGQGTVADDIWEAYLPEEALTPSSSPFQSLHWFSVPSWSREAGRDSEEKLKEGTIWGGRMGHTAHLMEEKMFVFFGYDGNSLKNDVLILDLEERIWERVEGCELVRPRYHHSSCQSGRSVFLFGGCLEEGHRTDELLEFRMDTLLFSKLKREGASPISPLVPRAFAGLLCVSGTLYLFGGVKGAKGGGGVGRELWKLDVLGRRQNQLLLEDIADFEAAKLEKVRGKPNSDPSLRPFFRKNKGSNECPPWHVRRLGVHEEEASQISKFSSGLFKASEEGEGLLLALGGEGKDLEAVSLLSCETWEWRHHATWAPPSGFPKRRLAPMVGLLRNSAVLLMGMEGEEEEGEEEEGGNEWGDYERWGGWETRRRAVGWGSHSVGEAERKKRRGRALDDLYRLDLDNGKWSLLWKFSESEPDVGIRGPSPRLFASLAVDEGGGSFFLYGGVGGEDVGGFEQFWGGEQGKGEMKKELWKFDLSSRRWSSLEVAFGISNFVGPSSVVSRGSLFVFSGGSKGQSSLALSNDIQVLSLSSGKWEGLCTSGPSPSPRCFSSLSSLHSSVFLYGGVGERHSVLHDFYEFNLDTYTWTEIRMLGMDIPQPRLFPQSVAFQKSWSHPPELLIFGGLKVPRDRDVDNVSPEKTVYSVTLPYSIAKHGGDELVRGLPPLQPLELDSASTSALFDVSLSSLQDYKKQLLEQVKFLKGEEECRSPELCLVCMGRGREVWTWPCGHHTMCVLCARGVGRCPMCRESIVTLVVPAEE